MNKEFPDDTFLARWLNGELTDSELKQLEARDDYPELLKIIEQSDHLQIESFDAKNSWKNIAVKTGIQAEEPQRSKIVPVLRWAAAAVILVAVLWFLIPQTGGELQVVSTQIKEKVEFTLPDNSLVELNSASKVSYHEKNWKSNRTLQLEGEAFFDVEKGATFIVETPDGNIEVLGTTFNVRSRESVLEVICYEGKVAVSKPGQAPTATLEKGVGIRIFESGKSEQITNIKKYEPAWKRGFSEFTNSTLPSVIKELERQFEIEIKFVGLADRYFTGGFPHDDLNLALQAVFEPMGIEIEKYGQVITVK